MGPARNREIRHINPDIPSFSVPTNRGQTYTASVPATLDLAERAALAVAAMTAMTDPEANHEIYWQAEFGAKPLAMVHDFNDWIEFTYYGPSILLRQACGSTDALDVEWHRMANLLQMRAPDRLLYMTTNGRPWATEWGVGGPMYATNLGEHFCPTVMVGPMLEAAATYGILSGDPRWRSVVEGALGGLADLVVDRGDYAYLEKIIYLPGEKGAGGPIPPPHVHHGQAWLADGIIAAYRMLGCEQALDIGHKLARFFVSHSAFVGPNGAFRSNHGATRFETATPIHANTNTFIRSLMLSAGIAAQDQELIDLARVGYDYAKSRMDTLMGYFPEWFDEGPDAAPRTTEICELAWMIHMARIMSTAGIADQWDDVDRWTRNMLTEAQLLETDWAHAYSETHGQEVHHRYAVTEGAAERCRGAWGGLIAPNDWQGNPLYSIPGCCVGSGARGLYTVWRDMVSWDENRKRFSVHLLLNRASPWADVNSHIPCRGQVDVSVKHGCDLALRIPEWASPADCTFTVDGMATQPNWEGRYAVLHAGAGGEVSLHCPVSERTERRHIAGTDYEIVVRGNMIVDITPGGSHHPIFCRPDLRRDDAPSRPIERFVADEVAARF